MCPLQYSIHSLYTQFTNSLKRTVSAKCWTEQVHVATHISGRNIDASRVLHRGESLSVRRIQDVRKTTGQRDGRRLTDGHKQVRGLRTQCRVSLDIVDLLVADVVPSDDVWRSPAPTSLRQARPPPPPLPPPGDEPSPGHIKDGGRIVRTPLLTARGTCYIWCSMLGDSAFP